MNSPDHFEEIVAAHYESLFRFALSLTRSPADAQDLTQQTFYVWATKGHQVRDLAKVKTWLFTTLHRTFLTGRRKQNNMIFQQLDDVSEELPAVISGSETRTDSAAVLHALASLDKAFQAAVALFYLEDCSYKEIAAILEVPIGTVRSRLARGLEQLRDRLSSGNTPVEARGWVLRSSALRELVGAE